MQEDMTRQWAEEWLSKGGIAGNPGGSKAEAACTRDACDRFSYPRTKAAYERDSVPWVNKPARQCCVAPATELAGR